MKPPTSKQWVLDKGGPVNYDQYAHPVAKPSVVLKAKTGLSKQSVSQSRSQRTTDPNGFIFQDKVWAKPTAESIRHTQAHQQQKSEILLNELHKRQVNVKQQAINSAAIQDHFMRNLKLTDVNKIGGIKPRRNLSSTGHQIVSQPKPDQNVQQILQDASKQEQQSLSNIEKKRIDYLNKLTLGQRLGLFDKPSEPLSQEQWLIVEQLAFKRKMVECAICTENLNFSEQTILSCAHVFHKTCFNSFQKFIKQKKGELSCPLCRTTNYDCKPFVEGQRRYLLKQCIAIQSIGRGFLARQRFYTMMKETNYKPQHSDIRKRLIGFKLSMISARQRHEMHKTRVQAGLYLKNADKVLLDTEALLASYYPNVGRQLRQKVQPVQMTEEQKLDTFWESIKQKALARNDTNCPICYNELTYKKAVLLSCSHLFHAACIANFERFERQADQHKFEGVGEFECSCPMCRCKGYSKIEIKL